MFFSFFNIILMQVVVEKYTQAFELSVVDTYCTLTVRLKTFAHYQVYNLLTKLRSKDV